MFFYAWSLFAAAVLTGSVLLYRAILPKPIPGIPHVKTSANSILGDLPDAIKHFAQASEMISFLAKRCDELNSPICQVFMRPFRRPWVILADAREAQDIMVRRTQEFDRSKLVSDLLISIVPHKLSMPTNDQWRWNRKLAQPTMSPGFLNDVAVSQVYPRTLEFVDLLRQKARLSQGFPFEVKMDIEMCAVDIAWAITFAQSIDNCRSQSNFLADLTGIKLPENCNVLVKIPVAPFPKEYSTIAAVANSAEIAMRSPLGRSHHWFALNFYPSLRQAKAVMDRLLEDHIRSATKKLADRDAKAGTTKSMVDILVERELALAEKERRRPVPDSVFLSDEALNFLLGGLHTTSGTVSWGFKYLVKHQDVQSKLRSILQEAFPDAARDSSQLPPEALAKSSIPYLDAFIMEMLRHSSIVPSIIRVTTSDTQVLGFLVPKGTDVFMLTGGPSQTALLEPINEGRRSRASQECMGNNPAWASSKDLADFRPERWLSQSDNGETYLNSGAAPMHAFGLGPRACFGRKSAHVMMRIIFSMVVWNFELLPPPDPLNDFKGVDTLIREPQNVHLRLKIS